MNTAQKIVVAAVVPAIVFVGVWFRESWWAWMLAIVAVGVFEWLWWARPEDLRRWWEWVSEWVQGPRTPPE